MSLPGRQPHEPAACDSITVPELYPVDAPGRAVSVFHAPVQDELWVPRRGRTVHQRSDPPALEVEHLETGMSVRPGIAEDRPCEPSPSNARVRTNRQVQEREGGSQ